MTIGRKFKQKPDDKFDDTTPEQKEFIKSHKFPTKHEMEQQQKEDSNYNKPDADGTWTTQPRQKSNIGVYRCCMADTHECNPAHHQDASKVLTRFWCKICGWELTLTQADNYMNSQRGENKF